MHLSSISQEMLKMNILDMSFKITISNCWDKRVDKELWITEMSNAVSQFTVYCEANMTKQILISRIHSGTTIVTLCEIIECIIMIGSLQ